MSRGHYTPSRVNAKSVRGNISTPLFPRNAPRHRLAVWKYTYIEGPLTGLELGGGVRHASRHHPRDGACLIRTPNRPAAVAGRPSAPPAPRDWQRFM